MKLNRIKKLAGGLLATAVAAGLWGLGSAQVYAEESFDYTESYVLSSEIDEAKEDGQYPRIAMEQAVSVAASALNVPSGTTKFGVTVPTHNAAFASYDKYIGIDVSKWNGDIDWAKVKAAGVDYAILRVGFRGWGTGTIVLDEKFHENIQGALDNDIQVGVYFFTQAINKAEAVAEANFAVSQIKGYNVTLPIIIDIEDAETGGEVGRLAAQKFNRTQYTNICKYFCDAVEAAGYSPMVYANPNWFSNHLYPEQLENKYGIWLAHYVSKTTYTGNYQIWQYSSVGKVSGISGRTDLNIFYMSPPAIPENLSATVAADKSVTVSWDRAPGAEGYILYSAVESGGKLTYTRLTDTNKTSYNAAAGTASIFAVKSYRTVNGKRIYSALSDDVYVNAKFTSPTGLNVTKYSVNYLTATWDKYKGALGYSVYIQENGSSSFDLAGTVTANTITIKNLEAGKKYNLKVCALVKDGEKEVQTPFSSTFYCATATDYPSGLKISSVAADSLNLSWDRLPTAERYQVWRKTGDTGEYEYIKNSYALSCDLKNLEPATKYTFKIRGVIDAASKSSYGRYSEEVSCYTKPAQVPNLVATPLETSVSLRWGKSGNNVTYYVYQYDFENSKYVRIAETTSTSFTVKNLKPLTKYMFAVNSVNPSKVFGGATSTKDVYTTVGQVTGLKMTIGASTVRFDWNKVANADGYALFYLSGGKYVYLGRSETNTYTIKNVPSGTAYSVYVRAYKKIDEQNRYAKRSDIVEGAIAPDAVKNLSFDHTGAKQSTVYLTWSKVPNATGYAIYSYDYSEKKYKAIKTVTTNYANLSVASGTNFTFKVRAFTEVNSKRWYGGLSAACEAFTRPAPPTLSLGTNTISSVTLKWDAPVGAAGYDIYRYNTTTKAYTYIGSTTGTSYKISGLVSGGTYCYAVRSYKIWKKAVWYSGYSGVLTTVTLPQKVTGVKYVNSNNKAVSLSWNKVTGASGYRIYSYDSATNKYTYLAETTALKATVSGLSPNKNYQFVVRSYKSCGGKKYYSPYLSDKVSAKTAPALPKALSISALTADSVTVKWDKVSGASGYRIYKYNSTLKKYEFVTETTAVSYKFTGLEAGTKYNFAVKPYVSYAGANRYNSSYISGWFYTRPPQPTGLKASETTESSVTLIWNKTSGTTGYTIYLYDEETGAYKAYKSVKTNSVTLSGFESGKTLDFKVRAYVSQGGVNYFGAYSKALRVTTSKAQA